MIHRLLKTSDLFLLLHLFGSLAEKEMADRIHFHSDSKSRSYPQRRREGDIQKVRKTQATCKTKQQRRSKWGLRIAYRKKENYRQGDNETSLLMNSAEEK